MDFPRLPVTAVRSPIDKSRGGLVQPLNTWRLMSTRDPGRQTDDPLPLQLNRVDRGRANATYDQFALAIASYEASPDVSPFSSKFDYAIAHSDQSVLSSDEQAGWDLFHGKAMCNTCHLDGTESLAGTTVRSSITPAGVGSKAPLFTDFTSSNIGVPRNLAIPYYKEDKPDKYGFISNPAGLGFVDKGVGAFLRDSTLNPNSEWVQLADQFDGKFQVSTLRNVDMRPSPNFVKAYTHNGYFKSLKEIVHFYPATPSLSGARGKSNLLAPLKFRAWTRRSNPGLTNAQGTNSSRFLRH